MKFLHGFFTGLGAFGMLCWAVLVLAAFYGWVMNIVLLVGSLGGPINTMFIARIVGIPVAVLGAVLGFVN